MLPAQEIIQAYQLQPHPEGGWYKETYKSKESIPQEVLPERFLGSRAFSTAIFFLLEQGNFSAFHRIRSDECWHFYAGDPLEVFILSAEEGLNVVTLGQVPEKGQLFQYVVPANCWFASRPQPTSNYSFVGCTVAPGFDFADFELADAASLIEQFPQQQQLISELCR